MYYIFADIPRLLILMLGRYLEDMVIDRLYHRMLPSIGKVFSVGLRALQVGLINIYLISIIFGFVILLVLVMAG
jgi:uncharacterized membrane protein